MLCLLWTERDGRDSMFVQIILNIHSVLPDTQVRSGSSQWLGHESRSTILFDSAHGCLLRGKPSASRLGWRHWQDL